MEAEFEAKQAVYRAHLPGNYPGSNRKLVSVMDHTSNPGAMYPDPIGDPGGDSSFPIGAVVCGSRRSESFSYARSVFPYPEPNLPLWRAGIGGTDIVSR